MFVMTLVLECKDCKHHCRNQSLVGLMMIDIKFGREDYCSIPAPAVGRWLKPLDAKTDPEPD
jgi:hypothetical protein